jgi:uncharacterized protein YfdQ (DUF2303 family)
MDTTSIDDFVRYSVRLCPEDEKARCFIDADNMLARSIFNIGTLDNPGHADNVASIKLKKTAPFRALLSINGDHLNQKQIAEWLEDWSDYLIAFDADGNTMKIAQAAQAVRRVTIQQTNASDHEDGDFSGKKSLMQSIEASSKDVMPVAFEFKCVPYEGLGERAFSLRNSLLKSNDPVFVLRIVQLEAQEEAIANEFRDLLMVSSTVSRSKPSSVLSKPKPDCSALNLRCCGDLLKRNPFIYRLLARDFYTQITALCRRNVWRK